MEKQKTIKQGKVKDVQVINPKVEVKKSDLFTLVKKEGNVYICLGNTQIYNERFKTFADAEKVIKQKPWALIINTTCFLMQNMDKIREEK